MTLCFGSSFFYRVRVFIQPILSSDCPRVALHCRKTVQLDTLQSCGSILAKSELRITVSMFPCSLLLVLTLSFQVPTIYISWCTSSNNPSSSSFARNLRHVFLAMFASNPNLSTGNLTIISPLVYDSSSKSHVYSFLMAFHHNFTAIVLVLKLLFVQKARVQNHLF